MLVADLMKLFAAKRSRKYALLGTLFLLASAFSFAVLFRLVGTHLPRSPEEITQRLKWAGTYKSTLGWDLRLTLMGNFVLRPNEHCPDFVEWGWYSVTEDVIELNYQWESRVQTTIGWDALIALMDTLRQVKGRNGKASYLRLTGVEVGVSRLLYTNFGLERILNLANAGGTMPFEYVYSETGFSDSSASARTCTYKQVLPPQWSTYLLDAPVCGTVAGQSSLGRRVHVNIAGQKLRPGMLLYFRLRPTEIPYQLTIESCNANDAVATFDGCVSYQVPTGTKVCTAPNS